MWDDILDHIARQSAREGTLPEPTPEFLAEIWPALVGDSIARLSSPLRLEDRTLHIAARNQSLVDDWKDSPLPLLRRLRRFAPWPIETLDIVYEPTAGVETSTDPDHSSPPDSDRESDTDDAPPPSLESMTEQAIDPELRSLIEAIDRHRQNREE